MLYMDMFESPIGAVMLVADDKFLYNVSFKDSKNCQKMLQKLQNDLSCKLVEKENRVLLKFKSELAAYFNGKIKKFTTEIKTFGSDFQKDVWEKLQELDYASTPTYGDLAKALGRSSSHSRAVGAACGANTHVIIIPCHRLVASGSIGGFSCGIDRKKWLINHEKKYANS